MDENRSRMDGPAQDGVKIILRWRVSAFLSVPPGREVPREIREVLSAGDFQSSDAVKAYWSVPERLADIQWIIERTAAENLGPDGTFQTHMRQEWGLYRIVTTFAKYCVTCEKGLERLRRAQDRLFLPEEAPVIPEVEQLRDFIQAVLPGWSPSPQDPYSEVYRSSFREGLQQAADTVCGIVNGEEGQSASPLDPLHIRVQRVLTILGTRISRPQQFKEYTRDKGRCIALLSIAGGAKLMAFSGFQDCEDGQLLAALRMQGRSQLIDDFRAVSQAFDADLAFFTTEVVDHIIRYELERDSTLRRHGPLRRELSAFAGNVSFLKKSYSCCERKLLAMVEEQRYAVRSAVLCVKFEPCLRCYGALRDWIDRSGITLTLDFPRDQT